MNSKLKSSENVFVLEIPLASVQTGSDHSVKPAVDFS
jgi:hypothetical protein